MTKILIDKEAVELALEVLKKYSTYEGATAMADKAIDALYQAFAKSPEQEPVAFITPLMEQQMFDDWCPYKGNPDPRTVWAAAINSVNGLLIGATQPQPQEAAPLQSTEQEPVAWETFALKFANGTRLSYEKPTDLPKYLDCRPLYTQPQEAARQPLSREVIERDFHGRVDFVRQVEAAHGIKGEQK